MYIKSGYQNFDTHFFVLKMCQFCEFLDFLLNILYTCINFKNFTRQKEVKMCRTWSTTKLFQIGWNKLKITA